MVKNLHFHIATLLVTFVLSYDNTYILFVQLTFLRFCFHFTIHFFRQVCLHIVRINVVHIADSCDNRWSRYQRNLVKKHVFWGGGSMLVSIRFLISV